MYPDKNSKSAQLYDRALNVLPGGNSRHTVFFPPYPIYAARGEGAYIWDVDGVKRTDFTCNWCSLIHGHNHPVIVEALKKQAETLLSVGLPTENEIRLAEILTSRLPGVDRVRFCNSGTEGVLMTLMAARAYTGRSKIAKLEGAYHGSAETARISDEPHPEQWGAPLAPNSVAPRGVGPGAAADVLVLPINETEAARQLISDHGEELAGVIIDPMPSHMGFMPIDDDFLAMLREETEKRGILLIFDEVYSFRLGFNGAQGKLGVTPDLTALGKVIGGGLPVGAIGGKSDIMDDLFDPRSGKSRLLHGGTFNANPMTMAAGAAALDLLDEDCFNYISSLGDRLRAGLRGVLKTLGAPGTVMGASSMAALAHTDKPFRTYRELVGIMASDQNVMASPGRCFRYLLNRGVYVAPMGLMLLSSPMTHADIDELIDRTADALRDLHAQAA